MLAIFIFERNGFFSPFIYLYNASVTLVGSEASQDGCRKMKTKCAFKNCKLLQKLQIVNTE